MQARQLLQALGLWALAAAQTAVTAQEEAPPLETIPVEVPAAAEAPPAAEDVALEAVVVTAQKRVESLQETPISIVAFGAEKLELRGIDGIGDLGVNVPNLSIEPFPTHNATLRIFIRGVGINDAQITQDPAVGIYADGVYIARSLGLALDIADLERIEVLRGPQGTLYGRNTTGGAVNLVTRRPSVDGFAMSHKLALGERGALLGKSSLNVPLGDALAVKLAYLASRGDGYVENSGPGGDFGDRDEQALRFDARWVPLYWLTADYAYDRTDMTHFNQYFQAVQRPRTNKGDAELFKPFAEANTVYSDQRLDSLSAGPPFEPSTTEIQGHAATATALLGDYELKYIGAYRELFDATYADLGGGRGSLEYRLDSHAYDGPAALEANNGEPTPLVIPAVTQDQASHELQLTGKLFDGALEFIAGGFYFEEAATEDRHRLNHQVSTAVLPEQLIGLTDSVPGLRDAILALGGTAAALVGPRIVNLVNFRFDIDNQATALFGQATWTPPWLAERLHLTFGYRHSDDERNAVKFRISETWLEAEVAGVGTAAPLPPDEMFDNVPATRSFTDDSFTYVAAFDVTPAINVYAKQAEAYKSGGFNIRDPNVSGASAGNTYGFGFVEGFAPEKVLSREAGIKSEWLQRRLRLNANLFWSDYTDKQENFLIAGTISDTKVRNSGKARMRGVELDATWLAARGLLFSLDYGYLDADVLEAIDITGENLAHLFPFSSAPPHSFVAAVDWSFLKMGGADLRAFLSYNYIDKRQGIVVVEERRDLSAIPAYGLVNARLSLSAVSLGSFGALDFALWGRNLADEVYPIMAIDNLPHADRAVVWGEPRTLGLDLIYNFY